MSCTPDSTRMSWRSQRRLSRLQLLNCCNVKLSSVLDMDSSSLSSLSSLTEQSSALLSSESQILASELLSESLQIPGEEGAKRVGAPLRCYNIWVVEWLLGEKKKWWPIAPRNKGWGVGNASRYEAPRRFPGGRGSSIGVWGWKLALCCHIAIDRGALSAWSGSCSMILVISLSI